MTRKAAWWGFSFTAGLAVFVWDILNLTAAVIITATAGVLALAAIKKYRAYVLSAAICFLLGLFAAKGYALFKCEPISRLTGKQTVNGVITDIRYLGGDSLLVTVKGKAGEIPLKASFFTQVTETELDYYDRVSVKGELELIENDIAFRSADYNYPKGIFVTGSGYSEITVTGGCVSVPLKLIKKYRDYVEECISSAIDGRQGAFVKALVCGDKTDMDNVTKTKLYRSGIGHLFAVSGLHLTAVTMFFELAAGLFISSRRVKNAVMLLIILLFAGFSGFSVSVIRAGIMLSTLYISSFFGRRSDCLNSIGLCSGLMGLQNPFAVKDAAFVLSLSAVLAIGVLAPRLASLLPKKLKGTLCVSLVGAVTVLFVTMPFTAVFFGEASLVSPITNIILVPLCTAALLAALAAMLFGGTTVVSLAFFKAAELLVSVTLKGADWFASLPFASCPGKYSGLLIALGVTVLASLCVTLWRERLRIFILSAAAAYALIFFTTELDGILDRDTVHIVILPNGNSSCTVIYDGNSCVLLDIDSEGELLSTVQGLFSERGIKRLDLAAFSDNTVYGALSAKNLLYPAPDSMLTHDGAEFSGFSVAFAEDGFEILAQGVQISTDKETLSVNDSALALENEEYPIEIIIDSDDCMVRRLDYGFDYGE